MNKEKMHHEWFGEVIYSYTRKQALLDGYQVLLAGEYADLASDFGWKYPVYMTRGVWDLIERAAASQKVPNDLTGVLWDILIMARFGKEIAEDTREFSVNINTNGHDQSHQLYIQVGPTDIDNPSPAITIMMAEDR